MEDLNRGLVAIGRENGKALVSWRLLDTDPSDVTFDLYRSVDGAAFQRINEEPIGRATCFVDDAVPAEGSISYQVRTNTEQAGASSASTSTFKLVTAPYRSVPLETPDGYSPNDASIGDLDGDGEFEIVIHQVGRGRDNSQPGMTTPPILEAYKLDGTLLWRINLGINIREGAHYTQFMVFDFDGDGCAEVACKTADGTTDGAGNVIGDEAADHRNQQGYILAGPEFLTMFDGKTGTALATTDYVPGRGEVRAWG